jgi:ribose transport system permease protein
MSATAPAVAGPAKAGRVRVLPPALTMQELILVGVIAVLWAILAFATPAFLAPTSLLPLLVNVAPIALIGVGMTFIILTAGIDVSIGAMIMVSAVVTAKLMVGFGIPLPVAVLVATLTGFVLGSINGVLVAWGGIHSIVVTFGTANVFQFIGLKIFNSQTVNNLPHTLDVFGRGVAGRTFGIPHSFALAVVAIGIGWWYLRYMRAGRHLYAIGGKENAARLAGVRTKPLIYSCYACAGALSGLAACIFIATGTTTLTQSTGLGTEMSVIAAVVIGGTSILGGRGSIIGTLLGALLVQTVMSGVIQLGWPSQLSKLFVGIIIVVAVGADIVRARRKK